MRPIGLWMVLLLLPLPATAAGFDPGALAQRLQALADDSRPAVLAVGVRDLDDGATVMVHGGRRLPMQSVFKLPLAVAVLDAAGDGVLSLGETLRVDEAMLSPAWSPLGRQVLEQGPQRRSLGDLLELAVSVSDNTAADLLADRLGGMPAVQRRLVALGVRGMRLDRTERELVPGALGIGPDPRWMDYAELRATYSAWEEARLMAAIDAHLADPRDTTTVAAMLDLLAAIADGRLLDETGTRRLLSALHATSTGARRLRAGLGEDWRLAHKTGSSATFLGRTPTTNDVGIAYGPAGQRIAIVALLADSREDGPAREARIAAVSAALMQSLR